MTSEAQALETLLRDVFSRASGFLEKTPVLPAARDDELDRDPAEILGDHEFLIRTLKDTASADSAFPLLAAQALARPGKWHPLELYGVLQRQLGGDKAEDVFDAASAALGALADLLVDDASPAQGPGLQ